jgi:hypothetical protein
VRAVCVQCACSVRAVCVQCACKVHAVWVQCASAYVCAIVLEHVRVYASVCFMSHVSSTRTPSSVSTLTTDRCAMAAAERASAAATWANELSLGGELPPLGGRRWEALRLASPVHSSPGSRRAKTGAYFGTICMCTALPNTRRAINDIFCTRTFHLGSDRRQ